jgi:hypothetical protein
MMTEPIQYDAASCALAEAVGDLKRIRDRSKTLAACAKFARRICDLIGP